MEPCYILYFPEFLYQWQKSRVEVSSFCLLICRLADPSRNHDLLTPEGGDFWTKWAQFIYQSLPPNCLLSQHSSSSFIIYLPETDSNEAESIAKKLQSLLNQEQGADLSIGIAYYPCLNFNKADILSNCRKALEHALLLTYPGICCFDSITLNISADRYFTQQDLPTALEEYKMALLLDEHNILARNSLGICYAKLGYYGPAYREFEKVLDQEPENAIVLYNLGYISFKLGEKNQARRCFEKCLEQKPDQFFCSIRLGQLSEIDQEWDKARQFYNLALEHAGAGQYAHRLLAKLEMKQGNIQSARQHLHQTLVYSPKDAEALHMLAKLYLEQGEDPEIAESLAQKSVALRPEIREYTELLERILLWQGKESQAAYLFYPPT